jgi:hypothetical protein
MRSGRLGQRQHLGDAGAQTALGELAGECAEGFGVGLDEDRLEAQVAVGLGPRRAGEDAVPPSRNDAVDDGPRGTASRTASMGPMVARSVARGRTSAAPSEARSVARGRTSAAPSEATRSSSSCEA